MCHRATGDGRDKSRLKQMPSNLSMSTLNASTGIAAHLSNNKKKKAERIKAFNRCIIKRMRPDTCCHSSLGIINVNCGSHVCLHFSRLLLNFQFNCCRQALWSFGQPHTHLHTHTPTSCPVFACVFVDVLCLFLGLGQSSLNCISARN